MRLLTLLFFMLVSVPAVLLGCQCNGWGNNNFCENVDTSYSPIALIVITDSLDYHLRRVALIENLNPGKLITQDTFTLLGEDGVNCGEALYLFEIGDTVLMALDEFGFYPNVEGPLFYLNGCGVSYSKLTNDSLRIYGPVPWIDYQEFRLNALDCFEQMGTINTRERRLDATAIDLFPNPASDHISFSAPNLDILQIDLYDLSGRRVKSAITATTRVKISDLQSGVCLARITTDQGVVTKRFIKQE